MNLVPRISKNGSIYNGSGYVDWLSKARMFVLATSGISCRFHEYQVSYTVSKQATGTLKPM